MKNEIYIGITGNRDISEKQIIFIKKRIEEFLNNFKKDNEFSNIIVLTPLADGVDRIIANSILENFLNIKNIAIAPVSICFVQSVLRSTHTFHLCIPLSVCG